MRKNNITETVLQIYPLFGINDSTVFVKWQIQKYFEQNKLEARNLYSDQEYMNRVILLKKLLKQDDFFLVFYKFQKIQECLVLNGLKGSFHLIHAYLSLCIEMLYKILTYSNHEKIRFLLSNDTFLKNDFLYQFLFDTDFLPIDSLFFYPDDFNDLVDNPLFETMETSDQIHQLAEYMNRKAFLFRDGARRKCYEVCTFEKKDNLVFLKTKIDEIDKEKYPFADIYQMNFNEIYQSIVKKVNEKSRSRKKSTYDYTMDLFQDSFDSSNSST